MNNRERVSAILNYESYDRLPILHFGYWHQTLEKWAAEGHISLDDANNWTDRSPACKRISDKLGFDGTWYNTFPDFRLLSPVFEPEVIKEHPDGSQECLNTDGVVVLTKKGVCSIPSEISHSLTDRKSWEELYKPRLRFSPKSVSESLVGNGVEFLPFDKGGLDFINNRERENPIGLTVGSLLGRIRDWLGVVGLSYLMCDDEQLLAEIVETVGDLCYKRTEYILGCSAEFDFAHYWEDICFKNGPLVSPAFFNDQIGPQYRRITELLHRYDIEIISLDCDGMIDALIPTWFENGVNTMFPIEVGTWNASIAPWREKYGKELRGVGGTNKTVFSRDYKAVDSEIERLKPLVELGGYIPCPDHRIDSSAKWENVQYYCDKMKEAVSG